MQYHPLVELAYSLAYRQILRDNLEHAAKWQRLALKLDMALQRFNLHLNSR